MNDSYNNCGCNNGNSGMLGGVFGGSNTEILFFLVVFLLLFTGFGTNR